MGGGANAQTVLSRTLVPIARCDQEDGSMVGSVMARAFHDAEGVDDRRVRFRGADALSATGRFAAPPDIEDYEE